MKQVEEAVNVDGHGFLLNVSGLVADRRTAEWPSGPLDIHVINRRRALSLLTSSAAKRVFDLTRESERVRDRSGNDINCQSAFMSRWLVEGTTKVQVATSMTAADK